MKDSELPLSEHPCSDGIDIKGKVIKNATYCKSERKINIYFEDGSRLGCQGFVEQDKELPTIVCFKVIPSYFSG